MNSSKEKETENMAGNPESENPGAADEDLDLVSAVKEFTLRQNRIRSNITKVTRDMISVINELENVKKDFQELSGKIAKRNQRAAAECQKATDRRKYTTPVKKNLDDAREIRKLNALIKSQGIGMADFVKQMDIANRTFYQKVEKHLFTMRELNYLRDELSLTDEEFMRLFFT
ncbi:MAG: hypothetical protein II922_03690 [Succinimonas sp.]|nr:hypothetical protein [Succinimonas sp.]MEE3422367.1 hypothetical protein [Succinimonas sp.]